VAFRQQPRRFALFLADPGGGVFTASGNTRDGWSIWSSVSEGHTTPGGHVTAVELPNRPGHFALFLADPGGEVFTASGNARDGWTGWSTVSQGKTLPGAPVTAVPLSNPPGHFALFLADPGGGVFTASGNARDGWTGWSNVALGQTRSGAPISARLAARNPDRLALFMTDPTGRIATTSGNVRDGWASWNVVAEKALVPGAPVTVVEVPPRVGNLALIVADPHGEVFATMGSGVHFDSFSTVSQGSTTPGAPVSVVAVADVAGGMAAFLADPGGGVFTTSARLEVPERPTSLRVIEVADRKIRVAWTDQSSNEDGFRVRFRGTRAGSSEHTGSTPVGRNQVTAILTGLRSDHEYTIRVVAFNAAGESESSNEVHARTPARQISVSNEGTGTATVFVVTGAGFTPNSRVVIRITAPQLAQVQFAETAGTDGKFVSRHAVSCEPGITLTFTAFEDADPEGTFANPVVTTCP
jgi:hypothetical protein